MFCALLTSRYQVSVYRTNGPLVWIPFLHGMIWLIDIHVISFKRESGRFSYHFREVFQKCKEYIGKLLIHIREIFQFCKKLYILEEI